MCTQVDRSVALARIVRFGQIVMRLDDLGPASRRIVFLVAPAPSGFRLTYLCIVHLLRVVWG